MQKCCVNLILSNKEMSFEGFISKFPELEINDIIEDHIVIINSKKWTDFKFSKLQMIQDDKTSSFLFYSNEEFYVEIFCYNDSDLSEIWKLNRCTIKRISHSKDQEIKDIYKNRSLYELDLSFLDCDVIKI